MPTMTARIGVLAAKASSVGLAQIAIRRLATHAGHLPKKDGDISSVFVSLSGASSSRLPERYAAIKRRLIAGNEQSIYASWLRLVECLAVENEQLARIKHAVIPQIDFADLRRPSNKFLAEVKRRGVAVVRGVIPKDEAISYKADLESYIKANPGTKAFPAHDPQVFELYWSSPQMRARAHPNLIATQRFLMSLWHSLDPTAQISSSYPIVYSDRLRIRKPGDRSFAVGPHVDGGSVERWEPSGYGLNGVYNAIWAGKWEQHDPWEASSRVSITSDLYNGAGACSMFRMFQGWLSMSHTGPGEGTLMVYPLLLPATAYFLLRPFFAPIKTLPKSEQGLNHNTGKPDDALGDNWKLLTGSDITSNLHGAYPGHSQELSEALHPHLGLSKSMVHIPKIDPGDYVVWHCDTIHAVDKVHEGSLDSSVMYIPVCPITVASAKYLVRQRETFRNGYPGPDFPGGKGEAEHFGRPQVEEIERELTHEGLQAMGLKRFVVREEMSVPEKLLIRRVNEILGFN